MSATASCVSHDRRKSEVPRVRFVRVPAVASLLILTACELPGRRDDQSRLGPVAERMRLAYPDLASGRFIILADFESPADAELFRITAGELTLSDERQPSISVLRARERTGAGGLKATLTNPDESIRLDGLRSQSLEIHFHAEFVVDGRLRR